MTFHELAAARYSVRSYKKQAVEPEKLKQILEAGRLAPTACNLQPQRIRIISAPEELEKVDTCTPCRFGAPVVLLVCYDRSVCWQRHFDGASSGWVDAGIVTTHMMLAAQELSLGTCWVMYFDPVRIAALFDLPETLVPAALLPLGYPAEDAAPAKLHNTRKKLEDLLI